MTAAGSKAALARLLDINHGAINHWTNVPLHRVLEIEKKLGVPREELLPELFAGFVRKAKH